MRRYMLMRKCWTVTLLMWSMCWVDAAVSEPVRFRVSPLQVESSSLGNIFVSVLPGEDAFQLDGDEVIVPFNELPYSASSSAQTALMGATTNASGDVSVTGLSLGNSASFTISGSGSATANRGDLNLVGNRSINSRATSTVIGEFYSECGPVRIQISGSINLDGRGAVGVSARSIVVQSLIQGPGESGTLPVDLDVVVEPVNGQTIGGFQVNLSSSAFFSAKKDGSSEGRESSNFSGSVTVTLSLVSDDCGGGSGDPTIYFWEGLNGNFNNASNWEPEGVPGLNDLAIFDKLQNYTVSFGAERSSRTFVDRGTVSWLGGSFTLGGGSEENPSLIVGNDAEDIARVVLANGHQLETTFATLGKQANNEGRVVVGSQIGAPSRWTNQGRLVVGQAGKGQIVVEKEARLNTNELIIADEPGSEGRVLFPWLGSPNVGGSLGAVAVGKGGMGTLIVENTTVTQDTARVGVEAGSEGQLIVRDSGFWVVEEFSVGIRGSGRVLVESGAGVLKSGEENLFVGWESGSTGEVVILGQNSFLESLNFLLVGAQGKGEVRIENGGALGAKQLNIGSAGAGEVTVTGVGPDGTPSSIRLSKILGEDIYVGLGLGRAILSTLDGARVEARSIALGLVGESAGIGVIDLAHWDAESVFVGSQALEDEELPESPLILRSGWLTTGRLFVFPAGALVGGGTITVTGDEPAIIEGTVEPGIAIVAQGDALKQFGPAYGRGRGFDTLTIKGDVMGDGSVIVMSVGGEQGGLQDRLIIEGDASFEDVTIKLEFKYGYAPREGDTIPLIEVMGDGSVVPASLEFLGLEEGFDFDIEIPGDGSVIQMRALSDGIPTSFRAEDLNEDGQVNAVDVQLVINGALGLLDPLETDVNFDKVTNAVDVQLVINAALGL